MKEYKECAIRNCENKAKWWYLADNEVIYLCSDHIPENGGDNFELGEVESSKTFNIATNLTQLSHFPISYKLTYLTNPLKSQTLCSNI